MGKLHRLRKAIQRNPKAWILWCNVPTWLNQKPEALCADLEKGQWVPVVWTTRGQSYRAFVKHVLTDLGFRVQ